MQIIVPAEKPPRSSHNSIAVRINVSLFDANYNYFGQYIFIMLPIFGFVYFICFIYFFHTLFVLEIEYKKVVQRDLLDRQ